MAFCYVKALKFVKIFVALTELIILGSSTLKQARRHVRLPGYGRGLLCDRVALFEFGSNEWAEPVAMELVCVRMSRPFASNRLVIVLYQRVLNMILNRHRQVFQPFWGLTSIP